MCEPTTLAAIGTWATANAGTIALVSGVGSAGLGAYSAYSGAQASKNQAQYAAATADNNSKLAEIQAQDRLSQGDKDAATARRNSDMLKGSQRASMAAKGLDLTEGTAQELQDQTDFFSGIDQATTKDNAAKDAWRTRQQGRQFSSDAAMQRSTASQISPLLATGTSLVGSAGSVAEKWKNR
jgi:hypothetical protein